jgi:hypothetical protein
MTEAGIAFLMPVVVGVVFGVVATLICVAMFVVQKLAGLINKIRGF